ncbi:MAG: ABC transporter ATP-binding protein [Chloroflexaceae bacterium]|nr:ABC transporter ATP-binding protein [Chloroflexaceae bacterium]
MIEAVNLEKRYGKMVAVKQVNLAVAPGEIFGFLGPNGSGKTTTIKMLIGLLRPSRGYARIAGYDIQREPIAAKTYIGYTPDQPYLPEKLTAREFLRFVGGLYQIDPEETREYGEALLKRFQLDERANDLIGGYSHGMRQKIALAGALLHRPRAFFLDEPTVGLDPYSARMIKDILRETADQGGSVFVSTHILEIAERMCDRVAIISKGEIIAMGSVDELRSGSAQASLEDIFLGLTGPNKDEDGVTAFT